MSLGYVPCYRFETPSSLSAGWDDLNHDTINEAFHFLDSQSAMALKQTGSVACQSLRLADWFALQPLSAKERILRSLHRVGWNFSKLERFYRDYFSHSPGVAGLEKLLDSAIQADEIEAVSLILKQSPTESLGYVTSRGFSTAVVLGRLKMVRFYLEDVGYHDEQHLYNSFIISAQLGYREIFFYFISRGLDIRYQNDLPFRTACSHGHLALAQACLDHGAEVNALNGDALVRSIYRDRLESIKWLFEKGLKRESVASRVFDATVRANSSDELIGFLFSQGFRPDHLDFTQALSVKKARIARIFGRAIGYGYGYTWTQTWIRC